MADRENRPGPYADIQLKHKRAAVRDGRRQFDIWGKRSKNSLAQRKLGNVYTAAIRRLVTAEEEVSAQEGRGDQSPGELVGRYRHFGELRFAYAKTSVLPVSASGIVNESIRLNASVGAIAFSFSESDRRSTGLPGGATS